jgi:hypothetical protein
VRDVIVLALVLGWTGFWGLVARIHYFRQDWLGLLLTGALGFAPLIGLLVRGLSDSRITGHIGETFDTVSPS